MALRLAIIEDNPDLLDELLAWLGYRGFEVWGTRSAEAFWRQLHSHPVDIVLIDIGLPGEDGFSVLSYLHELGHYGLVVVSARGQQQDKLQALSLGADAYLIKPVNFAHLAETLTALGARLQQDRPAPQQPEMASAAPAPAPAPATGLWRLHEDKLISPDARTLELTQQEYRLVELLMRNRNEVCSKLDLHARLFAHESEPDLHRIDVVVSRLRHKARQQGIHLPVRAIFGKGLAFIS
ncbi:TPA: response regulator transcription factor [Klebsiella quasipneumoniae]|uniref:response regulator transcription factor n=1 Tax=Klebsiella quasipneumoniae TaxID=1463165 RepID=UPI0021DA959A|nr:response regulator transcription factor [Klebsiella quasipneumoniae]MCU8743760.1 response regulator transcription factor [Klebsiella quasipneumoniae]HBV2212900.1 response regulator transcription factor [Klebsiella quasipneumoniae]HCT3767084.1 response regulator transcription factor [Klebsiella quasipneumoniae]